MQGRWLYDWHVQPTIRAPNAELVHDDSYICISGYTLLPPVRTTGDIICNTNGQTVSSF